MLNVVAALILFSRRCNENATTALSPEGAWTGQVDLGTTATFCASADWDMPVVCPVYEVRAFELPAWLPASEFAASALEWRYTWGAGVEKSWPESWQRGLRAMSFERRYTAAKLLRVKKFRSEFRKSLRDQLVAWLETPAQSRRFASPLTARQWDCLEHNPWEAKRAAERIYYDRDHGGRILSNEEATAALTAAA